VFAAPGTRLARGTGALRRVAVATFEDHAILGGSDALLEVDGALDPIP
jgi:hypothetical protein